MKFFSKIFAWFLETCYLCNVILETDISRQVHHREVAHTSYFKKCSSNPATEEQGTTAVKPLYTP